MSEAIEIYKGLYNFIISWSVCVKYIYYITRFLICKVQQRSHFHQQFRHIEGIYIFTSSEKKVYLKAL